MIYTATLTPMNEDLSVNADLLVSHIEWLLKSGAHGIALLGTTGEANSFSLEEKRQIIDTVVQARMPELQLMVGTGTCAYPETVELTQYALKKGVTDILMLPPFYYKQINDQGLENYFARVIEDVADDRMRIYLYHFPKMSGIDMSHKLIEQLMMKYPNQIVGMKDSSGDLDHMLSICRNFPNLKLFTGTERFLLPVLRAGGAGCISATANVTIRKIAQVFEHWQTDEADTMQDQLTKIRSIFDGLPFVPILKQYLAHQHGQEWLPLRPPNSLVAETIFNDLIKGIENLNFSHIEY